MSARTSRRSATIAIGGIAVTLAAAGGRLVAQAPLQRTAPGVAPMDAALRDFLARARAGTAAYNDRAAAIAAGYRRIGLDFPSMGEHWVNTSLLLEGRFDPARPAMLAYATVGGRPTLVGVIYAVPLAPGAAAPPLPGGVHAWHEHNGSVDEESLLPEHGGDMPGTHEGHEGGGTRLAILHSWTEVANPAGVFTAENYALPFARLRIAVPARFPTDAARSLALLSGGARYYERYYLAQASAGPRASARVADSVRVALAECRAQAERVLAHPRPGATLSPGELGELAAAWHAALARIDAVMGSSAFAAP